MHRSLALDNFGLYNIHLHHPAYHYLPPFNRNRLKVKKMNRLVYFLPILISLLLFSACELDSPFPEDSLILSNVNVLTMDEEEILTGQTVVITNGIIEWIGSSDEAVLPDGATVIEGDYYVMPGLAEMHGHIPGDGQGREYAEDMLALYVAQGVTFVRSMAGNPLHLELRDAAERGEILSPRIMSASPSFSGGSAPDAETARARVNEYYEAGHDLLKVATGMELEVFDAMAEEANALGIEFSGHIPFSVGLIHALEAPYGTIDHLDRYMEFLAGDPEDREDPPTIWFGYDLAHQADEDRIREAARLTAEAGVGNAPTNTLLENVFNPDLSTETMRQWPGMDILPSGMVENWSERVEDIRAEPEYDPEQARRFLDLRKQLTRALYEEGPDLLLLGADAPQIFNPPGFSVHRELEIKVDAGLTPFEALRTGTVNVGHYLGEEDRTGKVLPGFHADLLLLSVNPLETFPFGHAIEGVIRQGEYLSRQEIDELLEEIQQRLN
jgi:imidazolonepropionase-like amidohydrolase